MIVPGRFRGEHTIFMSPEWFPGAGAQFDARTYIRQLAESHVTAVEFYIKDHFGMAYYTSNSKRPEVNVTRQAGPSRALVHLFNVYSDKLEELCEWDVLHNITVRLNRQFLETARGSGSIWRRGASRSPSPSEMAAVRLR